ETREGNTNSDDLAHTRTLAERKDSKRNRKQGLKRRYYGGEPRRQTDVHRHKEQAELPHADEQPNGNDHRPAHIRPRHEKRRRQGDQPKAQSGEKERRKRLEADLDDDEVHRPTDRDDEREDTVPARHQRDALIIRRRLGLRAEQPPQLSHDAPRSGPGETHRRRTHRRRAASPG